MDDLDKNLAEIVDGAVSGDLEKRLPKLLPFLAQYGYELRKRDRGFTEEDERKELAKEVAATTSPAPVKQVPRLRITQLAEVDLGAHAALITAALDKLVSFMEVLWYEARDNENKASQYVKELADLACRLIGAYPDSDGRLEGIIGDLKEIHEELKTKISVQQRENLGRFGGRVNSLFLNANIVRSQAEECLALIRSFGGPYRHHMVAHEELGNCLNLVAASFKPLP